MEMIPIIISVSMFAMIAFIVSVAGKTKAKRIEAITDLQNRMIDKFGTAQEFVTFLQSPQGREFLGKTTEAEAHPARRIMGSIKAGIILTFLGAACIILSFGVASGFIFPGVLVLAIGLGFLVSAGVSLRLSRSWGLMAPADRELASQQ
ncbi:MAG TPA: hypothetical protein VHL58_07260 [Thermoanaerobaculia bacterium]|nr:hypothetical protein [Thermoanaerobaculia bacterium]